MVLIGGPFGGKMEGVLPGPLTLRMMERVVSSMNSTRTWVTPPRDPIQIQISCYSARSNPHRFPSMPALPSSSSFNSWDHRSSS